MYRRTYKSSCSLESKRSRSGTTERSPRVPRVSERMDRRSIRVKLLIGEQGQQVGNDGAVTQSTQGTAISLRTCRVKLLIGEQGQQVGNDGAVAQGTQGNSNGPAHRRCQAAGWRASAADRERRSGRPGCPGQQQCDMRTDESSCCIGEQAQQVGNDGAVAQSAQGSSNVPAHIRVKLLIGEQAQQVGNDGAVAQGTQGREQWTRAHMGQAADWRASAAGRERRSGRPGYPGQQQWTSA